VDRARRDRRHTRPGPCCGGASRTADLAPRVHPQRLVRAAGPRERDLLPHVDGSSTSSRRTSKSPMSEVTTSSPSSARTRGRRRRRRRGPFGRGAPPSPGPLACKAIAPGAAAPLWTTEVNHPRSPATPTPPLLSPRAVLAELHRPSPPGEWVVELAQTLEQAHLQRLEDVAP
jgi:hypothetical protein